MVIENVHGLQATRISLNDRFTMLASVAPNRVTRARTPQRRLNNSTFLNQNLNYNNRNLIEQIARKLQYQAKRRAVKLRLGTGTPLRRYGSEGSLHYLRNANSFGNQNQRQSVKTRVAWRQSNNNLSRSASFSNVSQGSWAPRDFRRRAGWVGTLRGRLRYWAGGRVQVGRALGRAVNRTQARVPRSGQNVRQRMRGRGRGGVLRNQANQKPVPTKEELDAQLDQYMASTKTALDKDLETYMKNAMEME